MKNILCTAGGSVNVGAQADQESLSSRSTTTNHQLANVRRHTKRHIKKQKHFQNDQVMVIKKLKNALRSDHKFPKILTFNKGNI